MGRFHCLRADQAPAEHMTEPTPRRNSGTRKAAGTVRRGVPAAMKVILFLILAAVVAWAKIRVTEALQNAAGLKLAQVKVTGVRYLQPEEVLEAAALPLGENMYRLDLKGAEERVKRLGWVERVYMERRLPRSLVVAVRERRPAALLDSFRLYGTDAAGRVLPVSAALAEEDLPLLSGVDVPPDAVGTTRLATRLRPGLDFLAFLARKDPDMAHDVSEVDLGEKGTLRVTFLDGVEARFGLHVTETELRRMAAVLSDLGGKGRRAASMDFRYRDSVFVKVRD
jgi:cell division protein FtsQ